MRDLDFLSLLLLQLPGGICHCEMVDSLLKILVICDMFLMVGISSKFFILHEGLEVYHPVKNLHMMFFEPYEKFF